jgi:hypothetical protein
LYGNATTERGRGEEHLWLDIEWERATPFRDLAYSSLAQKIVKKRQKAFPENKN